MVWLSAPCRFGFVLKPDIQIIPPRIFLYLPSRKKRTMDINHNKNEDAMKQRIVKMNQKLDKIHLGGGKKKIDKQHKLGKLTARERIEYITDKGSRFFEIGEFAGDGRYWLGRG